VHDGSSHPREQGEGHRVDYLTSRHDTAPMADEADNIVLEHLRHIRGQLDAMRADISELKTTQAGILQILAASQSHALRIDEKLARIEARLGLVDPAIP
jgi:DNA-binding FrmR family transcriptional regulator